MKAESAWAGNSKVYQEMLPRQSQSVPGW